MALDIEKRLEDARRELEIHTDNVMILQNDLQKLSKEFMEATSALQAALEEIEQPLAKAQQNYENAQREFERAQKVFEHEQIALRNAQNAYKLRRQNEVKQAEVIKRRLEEAIKSKEKEVKISQIRMKNAERDVAEYARQHAAAQKTPDSSSSHPRR